MHSIYRKQLRSMQQVSCNMNSFLKFLKPVSIVTVKSFSECLKESSHILFL